MLTTIDKISRLMYACVSSLPLKSIVFKAIVVMSPLLLENFLRISKVKNHGGLERRMDLWKLENVKF